MSEKYLVHYGVKGMKWGVRNAETRAKYAGKAKGSRHKGPTKYNSQQKFALTEKQKKYIKYGAIAAGAALLAVGGVTLYKAGAFQGYGAKTYADQLIKSSSKLQSMRFGDTAAQPIGESIYVSDKGIDKLLYSGPFTGGKQLFSTHTNNSAFRAVLSPKKNLKVAGKESGEKALVDMIKTGKLKPSELKDLGISQAVYSNGQIKLDSLSNASISHAYKLANQSPKVSGLDPKYQKMLFSELKNRGYSGVLDLNNVNPGYGAKRAMIIFDTENIVQTALKRQSGVSTFGRSLVYNAVENPAKIVVGSAIASSYGYLELSDKLKSIPTKTT